MIRIDFIVYQIGYRWGSGYQSITDQCNADIVADNVIGGGELVNLQLSVVKGGRLQRLTVSGPVVLGPEYVVEF